MGNSALTSLDSEAELLIESRSNDLKSDSILRTVGSFKSPIYLPMIDTALRASRRWKRFDKITINRRDLLITKTGHPLHPHAQNQFFKL